jgi:two-component system, OmpR family, phosphate regulon response regulator PhoB
MFQDRRFLIVDRSRNFHNLMRGILRSMGFRRVDAFVESKPALAMLGQVHVDLVFTDIILGEDSGFDFINDVRHKKLANPALPIVVLTSYTSRRNIVEAVSSGADHILAKPISPKLIEQRVELLLSRPAEYIQTESGYFGPDPERHRRLRRTSARRQQPSSRSAHDQANNLRRIPGMSTVMRAMTDEPLFVD